jgi:hypothetical protein
MDFLSRARFAAKLVVQPNGCITWGGTCDRYGYGRFKLNGRMDKAHRVAYELFVGPIPAGLVIDHLCRHRACVNPQHLEAVTQTVNIQRIIHVAPLKVLAA